MKNLRQLPLLASLALASFSFASAKDVKPTEGVVKQNDRVWVIDGDSRTELTKTITLAEGTKVSATGEVMPRRGAARNLQNDEMVGPDGVVLALTDEGAIADGVLREGGRVWLVKEGHRTPMTEPVSIGNATVSAGGVVTMGAQSSELKEGEMITLAGETRTLGHPRK